MAPTIKFQGCRALFTASGFEASEAEGSGLGALNRNPSQGACKGILSRSLQQP